ncbi:MAG: class I SAM-dependent methyltransferase family protein [Campylobacterota bacterium]
MRTATFTSFDKSELFYRRWAPTGRTNGKVICLLQGEDEPLAAMITDPLFAEYTFYTYVERGYGQTTVPATDQFMDLVRDLDAFVHFVCEREEKKCDDIFVAAHLFSGVVAATWVHDFAPNIFGMTLVTPAFRLKKPLAFDISSRQLSTLTETAARIVADSSAITVPTQLLCAEEDAFVEAKVQGDFYANLSSLQKQFLPLEGDQYDRLKAQEMQTVSTFIQACSAGSETQTVAQMVHVMQRESDKIAYGSLPWRQSLGYKIQRAMMNTVGRMSDGIRVGLKYGFDSGVTLDYVYENEPKGSNALGKLIDANYLNSIGWKGIRQRKVNAIALIKEKIESLLEAGQAVRILDIAGGPARYLIELAEAYPQIEVRVRDYQEQNVAEGRMLAKERGLYNISYEQVDAFDPTSYEAQDYRPNIAVISGVFELFSDNALISKAIKGVTKLIADSGYLLYTGQPWHPQLAFIAHVLGNHQQGQWVMRRRSQYELDTLFSSFGFNKEQMKVDDWGIFTVSMAQFSRKE